jgi:hypothetical protein
MKRMIGLASIIMCCLCVSSKADAPKISPVPELPEITAGQQVTIHTLETLPSGGVRVYLKTGKETKPDDKPFDFPATVDEKSLHFSLPADMPSGTYLVYVAIGQDKSAVPGQLRVLPDSAAQVHLDSVYPLTSYRNAIHNAFDFEIVGQNLAKNAEDNVVEIVDEGPIPMGTKQECDKPIAGSKYSKPCRVFDPGMEGSKLKIVGFQPGPYQGPLQVRVHVGNNVSNAVPIVFSGISQGGVVAGAAAVFAALTVVLLTLVKKGVGSYPAPSSGQKFGTLEALFLDRETNSYSLSKAQVLAWTAVTVYGYIYLFLCRTLIQWDFSFPPVAQNLPALFFASAGTTVAATAITSSRGSKGAGPIQPSWADFISTGGLVAGERFQFFIWTVVGCLGYVYLVVRNNPATLRELPNVPDNFLYLMGVSSAAYLGGKLVRKPGPIVKMLSVAKTTDPATPPSDPAAARGLLDQSFRPGDKVTPQFPVLTINLKGENLDPTATIKVDGQPVRNGMFWITPEKPQDETSGFSKEINVSLNNPDTGVAPYVEGTHTLTIVNTDGQAAETEFPVDPMIIDPVADLTEADTEQTLAITGKNFVSGISAQWSNPADGTQASNATVSEVKPTELKVKLIPGRPGTGQLTLISPIGLKARRSVSIKKAQVAEPE